MVKFVNNMKTAVLLAALMGLCMGIGSIWGMHGLVIGLVIGLISNGIAFFFSDRIALASMGAQEVTDRDEPELVGVVNVLADRAGMPRPRVYISPQQAPNAFATGRNPHHSAVCVTTGLMQLLNADELAGVIAHELSHVKHRDILISTIAATIAGAISMLAYLAYWFGGSRDREGGNPLVALLMLIFAPLAATLIQLAISRSREYAADAEGAAMVGTPRGLANALAKLDHLNQRIPMHCPPSHASMMIVQPLLGVQFATLFSTHPPTEKRIAALLGSE
ncbi:MAG: zinc metalloprotease HtpX [Phycisphaerae bacterium]|nr:zinc metalloprotease HtpX [Phycisphaerae bacterium]